MMPDKLYTAADMVKINCNGCAGCSYCCQEMGESVVLTPFDLYELTTHLKKSFDELMEDRIELYMTDGMVLPNLKMVARRESGAVLSGKIPEACGFLNEKGRCSIHDFRPGLCRLFPLGRNYEVREIRTEEGVQEVRGFRYFVVKDSCPRLPGTKVKIEKWLGIPHLKKYEEFITEWHYFCREFQEKMQGMLAEGEDEKVKKSNLSMLELFYRRPYEAGREFYGQFEERMAELRKICLHK